LYFVAEIPFETMDEGVDRAGDSGKLDSLHTVFTFTHPQYCTKVIFTSLFLLMVIIVS
jgi:hypothetical protein